MYVKNKMTSRPFTVTAETSVSDAFKTMKEHSIKKLPVMDGDKLVGIVSRTDLQQASPSKATTLSVFEINYMLSKLTVADAMTKDPITINENALLEEAAVVMREQSIRCLPVMNNAGKLCGIITETDIFDAFIEMMGFGDKGSRISAQAEDVPGALSEMTRIISEFGANISHVVVYSSSGTTSEIVLRINSADSEPIEKALEENGFKITRA